MISFSKVWSTKNWKTKIESIGAWSFLCSYTCSHGAWKEINVGVYLWVGQILNIYLESPNFSFAFQFLHKFIFSFFSSSFGNGSWKKVIVDHATFKERELVLNTHTRLGCLAYLEAYFSPHETLHISLVCKFVNVGRAFRSFVRSSRLLPVHV